MVMSLTPSDMINSLIFFATAAAVLVAWRANKTTLEAARDASTKTTEALKLTQETMQLAHRPSLHLDVINIVKGSASNESELVVEYALQNTGTDTAQAVTVHTDFVTQEPPTRANLNAITPIQGIGDIGAGMASMVMMQKTLTQPMRHSLGSAGRGFFVIVVTYRDEFRNHYRFSMVNRFTNGRWSKEDEWRLRTKVTAETDRTWDRH